MTRKEDKETEEYSNFRVPCWQRYVQADEGNKDFSWPGYGSKKDRSMLP